MHAPGKDQALPALETGTETVTPERDLSSAMAPLLQADKAVIEQLLKHAPKDAGHLDRDWTAAYLEALSGHLLKTLGDRRYIEPLRLIINHFAIAGSAQGSSPADELEGVYAVAAAEISYLILSGTNEQTAAQKVARKLITQNHPLPGSGGDPRGWMRLFQWREKLRKRKQPPHIHTIYESHLAILRNS